MKFANILLPVSLAVSTFTTTTALPVALPRDEPAVSDIAMREPLWGSIVGALVPVAVNWLKNKFKRDLSDEEALEAALEGLQARSFPEISARDTAEDFEAEFTKALLAGRSDSGMTDIVARAPIWGKIAGAVVSSLAPIAIDWIKKKFKRDLSDDEALEALAGLVQGRSFPELSARDAAEDFEAEFTKALLEGRSDSGISDLVAREPIWGKIAGAVVSSLAPLAIDWIKNKFKRDLSESEALRDAITAAIIDARAL